MSGYRIAQNSTNRCLYGFISAPPWACALCNLKRTIYHLFKVTLYPPSLCGPLTLSLYHFYFPWIHIHATYFPPGNCWMHQHPGHPLAVVLVARSAMSLSCDWSSERTLFESPLRCHRLTLRDSPCLFKCQCCNDSRRQTDWRQDPLDYFVRGIKRSSYTLWKDQGQEQWVLPQLNWGNYKTGETRGAKPCKGQTSSGKWRTLYVFYYEGVFEGKCIHFKTITSIVYLYLYIYKLCTEYWVE